MKILEPRETRFSERSEYQSAGDFGLVDVSPGGVIHAVAVEQTDTVVHPVVPHGSVRHDAHVPSGSEVVSHGPFGKHDVLVLGDLVQAERFLELADTKREIGKYMNVFGNLFAVLSMATSFIAMATVMKWVYQYDYNINKYLAWFITCAIPATIVLLNVTTFVRVLALIGAVGGGIEGIMIILMHRKAKGIGDRKPEYSLPNNIFISVLLALVFGIGLIITIMI